MNMVTNMVRIWGYSLFSDTQKSNIVGSISHYITAKKIE